MPTNSYMDPGEADRKEHLPNSPAVWAAMAKEAKDFDQDNVKRGKGDVDILLVFAGLFSAVLASFLVAVYPNLQPNPMDMMNYTLERIANQTASYNFTDGRLVATNPITPPRPFRASAEDIRVNVLWFASLIISLITSSFGMLAKQWMDDILAVEIPNPQARLRLRHLREPHIKTWLVYEIIACLPLLLHLSLGLFFVGLCYFTAAVHASIGYTTLPLVIGWTLCLFVATALPIFFPHCTYQITLLKPVVVRLHRSITVISHFVTRWALSLVEPSPREWNPCWPDVYTRIVLAFYAYSLNVYTMCMAFLHHHFDRAHAVITPILQNIPNEKGIIRDSAADLKIFASIDALRANDQILSAIVAEELPLIKPSGEQAIIFARDVLANRVRTVEKSAQLLPEWPFRDPFPISLVRAQAKRSIFEILYRHAALERKLYHRNGKPILSISRHDKTPTSASGPLSEDERMVLCALTMLLASIADSDFREVKLSSDVISFLGFYLDYVQGPIICWDVLYVTGWCCDSKESHQNNAARLLTALTKLAAPLDLSWKDRTSCFMAIQCIEGSYARNQYDSSLPLVWDYPIGFGDWDDWNVAEDAPEPLKTAVLEYLFALIATEWRWVENPTEPSLEGPAEEPLKILRCTLRQFVTLANSQGNLTTSALQAFVDTSARSAKLMRLVIEALVFADVRTNGLVWFGDSLTSLWTSRALYLIQLEDMDIRPSNATPEQSFEIWSSVLKTIPFRTDPDIIRILSLCHIAIFMFLATNVQLSEPHWDEGPRPVFSLIADSIRSLVVREEKGTSPINLQTKRLRERLAYGSLYLVDYEYSGVDYDDWYKTFSRAGSTAFPDDLIKVLGQFVEGKDEARRLYRLQELKGRNDNCSGTTYTGASPTAERSRFRPIEHAHRQADGAANELGTVVPRVQDTSGSSSSTGTEGNATRGLENEVGGSAVADA